MESPRSVSVKPVRLDHRSGIVGWESVHRADIQYHSPSEQDDEGGDQEEAAEHEAQHDVTHQSNLVQVGGGIFVKVRELYTAKQAAVRVHSPVNQCTLRHIRM